MKSKKFSWRVEVAPRHTDPVLFVMICAVLGGVAVYFFVYDNFFACALFVVFMVFITLEQFFKQGRVTTGVLGEKSVVINSEKYEYKDLSHFSVLDKNTILLYKERKDNSAITMDIRDSDFENMHQFFSAFLDEEEYEPGLLESIGRILSP